MPKAGSAFLALLSMFLIFFGVLSMFIPLVIQEAEAMAKIDTNLLMEKLQKPMADLEAFVNQFQAPGQELVMEDYIKENLINLLSTADLTSFLNSIFATAGSFFAMLFAVSFIGFFFLKDKDMFKNLILILSPTKYEEETKNIMHESKRLLTRYFIGVIIQISIIMALVSIGMSILGVKNAILIGFVAGIFNIIPYIGPIVGTLAGMLIALTTNVQVADFAGILPLLGKMTIVYAIVQALDNLVSQPLIFSASVKAHPIEIFVVILIAGNLAGTMGMIVAIPIYTILRIFLREFFAQFKVVKKLTENI